MVGNVAVKVVEANGRLLIPSSPDNARAVVLNVAGSLAVTDDDAVAGATTFQFGEGVEDDSGAVRVVRDSAFLFCSL